VVLLDPVWPLGLLGPRLGLPYGVILHGAEIAVPSRLPIVGVGLGPVLRGASIVVSAGGYPLREAERIAGGKLRNVIEIPPGVDNQRFAPRDGHDPAAERRRLALPPEALIVVSVSRLVPRKGMDVLIRAAASLRVAHPDLLVVIAGAGRDSGRLRRLIDRTGAPVRLLGRVSEEDKVALLQAGDVFTMVCRNRWGGLEQEGFGIVFLEAAAAGLPQIAGDSGGAAEAVVDGETGFVVSDPADEREVAATLGRLLADEAMRRRMGAAARQRATNSFDYDALAPRLAEALAEVGG
jgi:phosphatidylinositol alpha-1,6-mannosyltransferase